MRHMKKWIAALLALCLLAATAAMAEDGRVNDLLAFFRRATGQADEPADMVAGFEAAMDEFIPGDAPVDGAEEEIVAPDELVQVEDYAINDTLPAEWINILLLGTDSRTEEHYSRTDTMIVLSINPDASRVKLTSLMRDLWVDIPGHGGQKLNAACVYGGPELTMRCVNENFGLNIHSYVLVNMQCLASIVDSLGGIPMDVSEAEADAINKLFRDDLNANDENAYFAGEAVAAGQQVVLNGKQALAFARIRSLDSDYARTDRQRLLLTTIARQLQGQDMIALAGIVMNTMQYVETNMTFDDIMTLVGTCMKADLDALSELRLPADGTYQSGTFGGTWCIKADYAANAELLRRFIYEE